MCLHTVFRGKAKKDELAKLPDTIDCWKVALKRGNQFGSKYISEYRNYIYTIGWNKTKPIFIRSFGYKIGFHAFLTKKAAHHWSRGKYQSIVKCKIEKKDIVAVGKQLGHLCIVTKRIWIPKPRKKSA